MSDDEYKRRGATYRVRVSWAGAAGTRAGEVDAVGKTEGGAAVADWPRPASRRHAKHSTTSASSTGARNRHTHTASQQHRHTAPSMASPGQHTRSQSQIHGCIRRADTCRVEWTRKSVNRQGYRGRGVYTRTKTKTQVLSYKNKAQKAEIKIPNCL